MQANDAGLWSVIASFLHLQEMKDFSYSFPIYLSDERVERIACAWHNLTHLAIDPMGHWGLDSEAHKSTFNSLSYFAQNCPKLESLAMPILYNSPLPNILSPPTLFAHPLHTFRFTLPGNLEDVAGVAIRLDGVFPSLDKVSGEYSSGNWWKVTSMIKDELQATRRGHGRHKTM